MKLIKTLSKISKQHFFLYTLLILMVLICSCNSDKNNSIIYGKINNASGKTVILEVLSPGNTKQISSVAIDKDGSFKISCDSLSNSFLRLKIDDKNFIYLKINNGEKIEINADYPHIQRNYSITGSDDCILLKEMNVRLLKSSDRLSELKDSVNRCKLIPSYNIDSLWQVTNEEARALYESDKNYLIEFIKKNHKSAVIYMALYQYIGISPILMIDNDLEIFEYVLGELQKYHPKLEQTSLLESEISKHKLLIKQRTNDYISLKPGMQAPDFILPDINSKLISLSAYKGTKVVICFWSSWSKTSVNYVKKLISSIANNSKISLILISLDTKTESWKSSIQNNELDSFVNLCDFKTWESPVIKIYGIKMLPTFIMINDSGEIEIISEDFSEILNSINNTN